MNAKYLVDIVRELATHYVNLRYRRSPWVILLNTGVAVLGLVLGLTILVSIGVNLPWLTIKAKAESAQVPDWITATIIVVALLLIIAGACGLFLDFFKSHKSELRKRVLGVQLLGLTDAVQTPLIEAIPAKINGQRKAIMVDIREPLKGGHRLKEAVDEVNRIGSRLRGEVTGLAVEDFTIFAGGLAPVPILFQFGNMLDDESRIHWMDWLRDEKRWIELNEGKSISAWPEPDVTNLSPGEVVLAIPVSYPITDSVIEQAFPGTPVLRWAPQERALGAVIDEESTRAICNEFRNLLIKIFEQGISHVHLVMAAPSALSIRLGNSYDARNMLPVTVYQFEQTNQNPYPWGIRIVSSNGVKEGGVEENPNLTKETSPVI